MGELAIVPQGSTALAHPAADFSIRDMERMALAFAQSGLFGVKTPDQALALCLIAHAEGRHPALAARDYDIIQGRPSKKAEAMQRDFLTAGGKIEWHQMDDACADATFSHPQGGSVRITWDMDRAKVAGLGGKDMWKKFPRQMLRSRVVSEGVRAVFPNATSGMYVPEEVRDFGNDAPAVPAAPAAKRARDITLKADDARAKAEGWVRDQLAAVESVATLEDLDVVIAGGSKAVAKLAREHADLHGQVQAAYEDKAAALNGYEPEGKPETDMGEGFTGAEDGAAQWEE